MGGEFGSGAAGAGAAELAMELFGKELLAVDGVSAEDKKALLQLVGLTVSKIVASASGASDSASNAAATTAKLAVENNWLKHQEKEDLAKFKAACDGGKGNKAACERAAALESLSEIRDLALRNACTMGTIVACMEQLNLDPAAKEYFLENSGAILSDRGDKTLKAVLALTTRSMTPADMRALGGALGVAASIGSLGDVVKPEFWAGMRTLLQSDDKAALLRMGIEQVVAERQGDYAMYERLNDEFGKGMVVGRNTADLLMLADAIASIPMLAAKVGQLGTVVVINGIRYANIGGKIIRQAFVDIKETAQTLVKGKSTMGSAADSIYSSIRPMEEVFPELKGVNPHYVQDAAPGVNTNCVPCANAAQQRLTGENPSAVATPSNGYYNMNDLLPSAPLGVQRQTTVAAVQREMAEAGNGAVGIVTIIQPGSVRHVINVVNKGGQVYFVNVQMGMIVSLKPHVPVQLGRPL